MLALIAGRGGLPAAVHAAQAAPPLVCALRGNPPDTLAVDVGFRIETLGTFLQDLTARGVTDLCLCGAIDRPAINPAALDAATRPLLPLFMQALAEGDDGALRLIMRLIEAQGMRIRAAHELAPELVMPAGIATRAGPCDRHAGDVQAALAVLADQGWADLGQACVIRAGHVLAREDARGTDAMLADLAPDAPGGGILFKAPKPGQDHRADLPAIGPETVRGAVRARLDGIVIAAGGVIVLDRAGVVSALDAAGLFLWVR